MARKPSRKAEGSSRSKANAAPGSKIRKIEQYEDTLEEGGVDDFMFKRDQIMFNPQDESDNEDVNANEGEEVLGLNIPSDQEEEDEEEYYPDEDDAPNKKERKQKAQKDVSGKGRFGKPVESSEEEEEDSESEDEDEEGWGRSYYSRPSNRREKEDENEYDEKREEEREMEEREVKRLQKKAREAFESAEDWGLEEGGTLLDLPVATTEEKNDPAPVTAPQTTDPVTLIRHLESKEPVKIALARDYPLIVEKLRKTAEGVKNMMEEKEGEENLHKGLGWLHYQTLLTYATTLAFYIHLCALPPASRPNLSEHVILDRLLQLKEGVAMLEDLDFAAGSESEIDPLAATDGLDDQDEEELKELMKAKKELMARMMLASGSGMEDMEDEGEDDELYDEDEDMMDLWQQEGLEDGELDDLMADAEEPLDNELSEDEQEAPVKPKKKKVKAAGKVKPSKEKSESKKEKSNGKDTSNGTHSFTPLQEPTFVSSSSSKTKRDRKRTDSDILGDPTALDDADAVDKERRKRSLQFHTAKIASTSARRAAARAERLGGDEDLPYRDRQAARDAALRKNSAKSEGEALDGREWDENDRKRARDVREETQGSDAEEEGDGYYDLVKRRKTADKAAKTAAHEEEQASKFAEFEDDNHAGGPRALTRAIEKNRGLTPRRSKTGRNPRVKKRLAYEKAKQKVGSQRAVFKGGQASLGGSYSGEKTGISQVIKSRKF